MPCNNFKIRSLALRRRCRGALSAAFQCSKVAYYKKDRERHFTRASSDWTRIGHWILKVGDLG